MTDIDTVLARPADSTGSATDELQRLYEDFEANAIQGLWRMPGLLTSSPVSRAVPHRWAAETLKGLADRARALVPVDRGGDRRVLACANPGLHGLPYATSTLWAAVQALGPGEHAPAHRHTPAALRFVMSGSGVWTTVDGDPLSMSAGDLVLTPSWTFHEHRNHSADPMTWLDVLDLPIVEFLEAIFFETGPDRAVDDPGQAPARSSSELLFGGGPGLLPVDVAAPTGHSPLMAYRWTDTDRALRGQVALAPHRLAAVRFADPTTGGDPMPTLRCEMFRLGPTASAPAFRQTGSRVITVLQGSGRADVGSHAFSLTPGDIVAVPSWTTLSLTSVDGLDLFSVSDAPVLEALRLFRTERVAS